LTFKLALELQKSHLGFIVQPNGRQIKPHIHNIQSSLLKLSKRQYTYSNHYDKTASKPLLYGRADTRTAIYCHVERRVWV
jgi:hypothetical protein